MIRMQVRTYTMLQRLSYISRKISTGTYPNSSDLAKSLECSVSTISRDLEFLRDRLAAPIEWNRTLKGYCYSYPWNLYENL